MAIKSLNSQLCQSIAIPDIQRIVSAYLNTDHMHTWRLVKEFRFELLEDVNSHMNIGGREATEEDVEQLYAEFEDNESEVQEELWDFISEFVDFRANILGSELFGAILAWFTLRYEDDAFCQLTLPQQSSLFYRHMLTTPDGDAECITSYEEFLRLHYEDLQNVAETPDCAIRNSEQMHCEGRDSHMVPCEMILYHGVPYCFKPYHFEPYVIVETSQPTAFDPLQV